MKTRPNDSKGSDHIRLMSVFTDYVFFLTLFRNINTTGYTFLSYKKSFSSYRKVLKFSDTKNFCRNLSKIQTKWPNLRVFSQEDANGIANSEDPDQTAPLGAV